jgi:uncharacterized protein YggE
MRRLSIALTSALFLVGFSLAQGQERPAPLVIVTGEATMTVAPDTAELRGGVTAQGKTAREASAANARTMTPILAALKESGVAAEDIQTSRLTIQPVQDRNRPGADRITGFQASNQVTVRIRDITKVGDIVDRLVAAGANELWGIEFLVSKPSRTLDAIRPEAIADARRKAEIYARAAGLELGRAIAISEEGASPPIPLRAAVARAAPATPIATGQETLRLTVTVSFELLR